MNDPSSITGSIQMVLSVRSITSWPEGYAPPARQAVTRVTRSGRNPALAVRLSSGRTLRLAPTRRSRRHTEAHPPRVPSTPATALGLREPRWFRWQDCNTAGGLAPVQDRSCLPFRAQDPNGQNRIHPRCPASCIPCRLRDTALPLTFLPA